MAVLTGSMETAASTKGAWRLMSIALETSRPGAVSTLGDGAGHGAGEAVEAFQAGPLERENAVVIGEALGEPQLAGHVGALVIEGFERPRPDALNVPGVEELVRHGVGGVARPSYAGPPCR